MSEPSGEANLLREGADPARIHFAGNVMIDTLLAQLDRATGLDTVQRLGLTAGEYAVLTLHRPSNVDDPARLAALFDVLEEIQRATARRLPGAPAHGGGDPEPTGRTDPAPAHDASRSAISTSCA